MKRSTITAIAGLSLGVLLLDAARSGSYLWAAFGLFAAGLFLFFTYFREQGI